MYAVTSKPLVSRTRATFRSAEFGFLGVVVYTRVHTPRRCGLPFSAGVLVLPVFAWRPLRTNCWMVGIRAFVSLRPPSSGGRTVVFRPPRSGVSPGPTGPDQLTRPGRVLFPCGTPGGQVWLARSAHARGARDAPGHEGKEYPPSAHRSKRLL